MRSRPGRPQIAGLPEKAKVKTLVLWRVSFQITESPLPAHSISSTIWKEMLVSIPPLSSPLPGNPGPWLGRGLSLRPGVFLHRPLRSPGHLGDWPNANAKGSLRSFHCHFNLSCVPVPLPPRIHPPWEQATARTVLAFSPRNLHCSQSRPRGPETFLRRRKRAEMA